VYANDAERCNFNGRACSMYLSCEVYIDRAGKYTHTRATRKKSLHGDFSRVKSAVSNLRNVRQRVFPFFEHITYRKTNECVTFIKGGDNGAVSAENGDINCNAFSGTDSPEHTAR